MARRVRSVLFSATEFPMLYLPKITVLEKWELAAM
jgi:hypothetical protein